MSLIVFAALVQVGVIPADSGERHLENIRQLTFGGQNAEAYFSRSGTQIILQRTENDVANRIRLCIPITRGERQTNSNLSLTPNDPTNPIFNGSVAPW